LCENERRLCPELWRQKNGLLHHDNAPSHTSFFTRESLAKNIMSAIPQPPYFSLFHQLKIKPKSRHFDTIEVMEAESLNSLAEHDFQAEFKK
jgi:hypothetical protein